MSRECLICTSEFRSEIEQQFKNGDSYKSISDWCKKQGFKISLASIERHLESHFLSDNDDALTLEIPQFKNNREIAQFIRKQIIEAYALQSTIVTQKQRLYMQGKGKYPNVEISSLKTLSDVLNAIQNSTHIITT
jgi:flagellar basal body P-ring protein FlgI